MAWWFVRALGKPGQVGAGVGVGVRARKATLQTHPGRSAQSSCFMPRVQICGVKWPERMTSTEIATRIPKTPPPETCRVGFGGTR